MTIDEASNLKKIVLDDTSSLLDQPVARMRTINRAAFWRRECHV